jgi:uncharacterized phage protein (TIGR01671 family)
MNREIKFRIWANNQFYYKCLVGNTNDTDDKKYTCPVVWLDDRKEWVNCDNGIISQYTGLKDKNGIEIYEGDKVKAKFYGKEVVGEIGFNSGCFLLWNSCVSDNQLFIFTDIEVIGNIYENEVD